MPTDGKHQPLKLTFSDVKGTPETLPGLDEEEEKGLNVATVAGGGAGRLGRDKVASRVKRQK